ncbi:MAG: hypothetical protein EBS01_03245 [Verrucomicrobia bacterium]|nr:hypothetical protein [Verrucomicrobiota bacterium]
MHFSGADRLTFSRRLTLSAAGCTVGVGGLYSEDNAGRLAAGNLRGNLVSVSRGLRWGRRLFVGVHPKGRRPGEDGNFFENKL